MLDTKRWPCPVCDALTTFAAFNLDVHTTRLGSRCIETRYAATCPSCFKRVERVDTVKDPQFDHDKNLIG